MVKFAPLNLSDGAWPALREFARDIGVVLCGNVMIYSDKPTQRRVLEPIAALLRLGGLLFAGHSGNPAGCRGPFALRGGTLDERL